MVLGGTEKCGQIKCMCVYVIHVLCHFQVLLSRHIMMLPACCMRRDSARILSAANTDAPCRRHKSQDQHPVTLS